MHIAVMYAQSRSMPGGAAHSITCHQDKKGRRYRYYVSAALITEAGTDRAQGGRIVARVLGPRPERLSICGAGLCPPEPLIRLRIAASSNADVLEPDGDRLAVRNYLYPYARVIARALAARVAEGFWVRFVADSPMEGDGFEPSVPPKGTAFLRDGRGTRRRQTGR